MKQIITPRNDLSAHAKILYNHCNQILCFRGAMQQPGFHFVSKIPK